MPIVTTALGLRLRIEGREASLVVEEHGDFGSARDIVLLSVLIGIWRAGEVLTVLPSAKPLAGTAAGPG